MNKCVLCESNTFAIGSRQIDTLLFFVVCHSALPTEITNGMLSVKTNVHILNRFDVCRDLPSSLAHSHTHTPNVFFNLDICSPPSKHVWTTVYTFSAIYKFLLKIHNVQSTYTFIPVSMEYLCNFAGVVFFSVISLI